MRGQIGRLLIKQVALECPYNNETMTCFSYNNINYWENENLKPVIFNDGISTYNVDVLQKEAYLVKKMDYLDLQKDLKAYMTLLVQHIVLLQSLQV